MKLLRLGNRPQAEPIEAAPLVTVLPEGPRVSPLARIAAGGTVSGIAELGGSSLVVGEARVTDRAKVLEHAVITGRAVISGAATVSGWASVSDRAQVCDEAWVFGRAVIEKQATICGQAQVFGDARVSRLASVGGDAWVYGQAVVTDLAAVRGRARIGGQACIRGDAIIDGPVRLGGFATVGHLAHIVERTHFAVHQLPWGDWVTFYRCVDGWVGAGLHAGRWCGPLPRNRVIPELAHLSDRITELAERWWLASATSLNVESPAGQRSGPA